MFLEECCSIINRKLGTLPQNGEILVWGAGENAVRLFQYTELLKYNISYIVDKRLYGQTFYGKIIENPEDILWENVDAVIISVFAGIDEIKNDISQRYNFKGVVLAICDDLQTPLYKLIAKKSVTPNDEIVPILQRNGKYKNCHAGERVFILCTGPSIAEMDLKKLKDEKTIAVNSFYLHKDCQLISPDYYCEPAFEEFDSFDFLEEHLRQMQENALNSHYFFGVSEKKNIEKVKEFENKCVNYLSYVAIDNYEYIDVDLTSSIMLPQSTPIMALEIALYMGFQTIYLMGVEHSDIITRKHPHFYNYHESISAKSNKYADEEDNTGESFDLLLTCTYNMWKQYKIIKHIAERMGIKIYNATKGGVLDVFERVDYDTLF